jgi:hypothetical protein
MSWQFWAAYAYFIVGTFITVPTYMQQLPIFPRPSFWPTLFRCYALTLLWPFAWAYWIYLEISKPNRR